MFTPKIGEDFQFDEHIFQMGAPNHQPIYIFWHICFTGFLWIHKKNWVVVSNIFYVHPYLGKWSNLTSIFFRWVETTNQLYITHLGCWMCMVVFKDKWFLWPPLTYVPSFWHMSLTRKPVGSFWFPIFQPEPSPEVLNQACQAKGSEGVGFISRNPPKYLGPNWPNSVEFGERWVEQIEKLVVTEGKLIGGVYRWWGGNVSVSLCDILFFLHVACCVPLEGWVLFDYCFNDDTII